MQTRTKSLRSMRDYLSQQLFTITVFTRVIHALFFNKNFVSKFRVRHLCAETILRRFIMKLKCDNQ